LCFFFFFFVDDHYINYYVKKRQEVKLKTNKKRNRGVELQQGEETESE